jgi:hypothetical protein
MPCKSLNWSIHTRIISLKFSRAIGILNHIKLHVPQKNLIITIYHALITPHLNYQLLSWGYDYTNILKLQKKAIRTITSSHFIAHTEPLYKKLQILIRLPDLHSLIRMKFLFKFFKNDLPGYFMHNTFITNNQIHPHNTIRKPHECVFWVEMSHEWFSWPGNP